MSVTRASESEMLATDGSVPPGKTTVLAKLRIRFSPSNSRSSIRIAWSSIAPSSVSRREQAAKYSSKCRQPTASIISRDTSRSKLPASER